MTILKIYIASWNNASVPDTWKYATIIPICMKGKDKIKADSISLTSCIGKLMDRLINSRLTWYLEKGVISDNQAWQHRSTEEQVTHTAQEIEETLLVFLTQSAKQQISSFFHYISLKSRIRMFNLNCFNTIINFILIS